MTFEDLQKQWKEQEAKLETILHLNVAALSASHFTSLSSALDRVRRAIWIELVITAAAVLMTGSFIGDHYRDVRYLVPAVVLHLAGIALVGACVRDLVALREIDYAGPVVEVQRRLTRLKISRIRTSKWTLLAGPALWVPLLLVIVKGWLGVDAYTVLDPLWIAANVVFGLAFIALVLWIAERYGERISRSPLLRELADDLAGRSVNDAAKFAQRLAAFEDRPDSGVRQSAPYA